jgi:aspartate/methionine/tyrosine aminotransferase
MRQQPAAPSMPRPAARNDRIEPFYVMEVVKEAARLQTAGRSVIHMSIGEPDFTAPPAVRQAAIAAIEAGRTQYTAALGLQDLREAISQHYRQRFGLAVSAERIVVTAGASGALLLALAALLDEQRELLMPDPSYPCNRHFATVCDGSARLVPCSPQSRFQLTPELLAAAWSPRTAGVLLASPSNPTGTSIDEAVLRPLIDAVHARDGFVLVDEIYQGLSYDHEPRTALALSDRVVVINSFSKYFSMTGWRLGWLVVPPALRPVVEKLAQNLFICPSAVAQQAAVACFAPESIDEYEARRAEFKRRRDYLVPALQSLGLKVPVVPDGAFYVYVDVSAFSDDSWAFAFELLHATGVCVVPGRDFGHAEPSRYIRVSYATSLERLQEAIGRLRDYLGSRRSVQ